MPSELELYGTNPGISDHLHVWGWEIPVYLFLGGLAAGLLVLAGISVLTGRDERWRFTRSTGPWIGFAALAAGMFALFLDLEYKAHVFRFYTAFKVASPMSWGSWILVLVFPVLLLGGFASGRWRRPVAALNVVLGSALGIYTGILLGALGARPFWNSAVLGPLFLASGVSAAAALVHMASRSEDERRSLAKIDVVVLGVEAVLLGLLVLQLATGGEASRRAADLVLGGPFTAVFWVLVVFAGIALPIAIQGLALARRIRHTAWGPALVLFGGLALRTVIVFAGQASEWRGY